MNINVEKFLAITATIAAVGACTAAEDTDTDGGTGGSGGTAAGGTGGEVDGGAGQSQGGAGAAGAAAGAGGSVGGQGGTTACLGDETAADAGTEGICDSLPYAMDNCDPAGYVAPLGLDYCLTMSGRLRAGVYEALVPCLAAITAADSCSPEHDTAATDCYLEFAGQACPLPDSATACAEIVADCTTIPQAECEVTLHPYTPLAQGDTLTCYETLAPDPTDCEDVFNSCLWDPAVE